MTEKPTPKTGFFYAETPTLKLKKAEKLLTYLRTNCEKVRESARIYERPLVQEIARGAQMHSSTYRRLMKEPIIRAEIELYERENLHRPLHYYERLVLHQALQGDVPAQREFRQLLNGLRKQIGEETANHNEATPWAEEMEKYL